jgi:metabolite-proton symporter
MTMTSSAIPSEVEQPSEPPRGRGGEVRKVAVASFVGTTIEYYDFFIFGTAAALVFPKLFFPEANAFLATLLAFASFGVGFFARPVGGALFGHYGDRIGRKRMLVLSLVIMGTATTLIGLLPTYATLGSFAAVLLVTLRFLQGIAVGGEWGGAVLMAVEHSPPGRRGFYGSFPPAGAPVGTVLATGVFLLVAQLPEADFVSWGWRIPFLASALLVVVGLFVRLSVTESPSFRKLTERQQHARVPLVEVFRSHTRGVLLVAGAFLVQSAVAYIYVAYLATYATSTAGASRSSILTVIMLSGVVCAIVLVASAVASDRLGRKPVYLTGIVLMGVLVYPSIALIDTGLFWPMLLGHILVFGIGQAMSAGPSGAMFAEVFPARIRYSGISIGYQLASVGGAALAPIIAALLLKATGSGYAIAGYISALAVISLIAVLCMSESHRTALD